MYVEPMPLSRRTATTAFAALACSIGFAAGASAAVPYADIAAGGPLEHIDIGNELSCQVAYRGDTALELYPPQARPGDCGTFLSTGGTLYAPDFSNHDGTATAGLGSTTPFTPVSQSAVTGSGTSASPLTVTTVADAGDLRITEINSYVSGQESYRTDVTIRNNGGAARDAILYRAGDCYLQESDIGFGFVEADRRAVGCSVNANNSPPNRIEEWVPISGDANYYEAGFSEVWAHIGSQAPFPNTCRCDEQLDNGAGLSWNISIPAGGEVTRSHFTTFSPSGRAGPPPDQPPQQQTSIDLGNDVVNFIGPGECVRPGESYRLRVTSTRKRQISKDRFGFVRRIKILRVDFLVDGRRRVRDRKAAFKALLSSAGLAPGSTHTLTARVQMRKLRKRGRQVQIGKKFTRRLPGTVSICAA
jgi:hypothetical protein